MKWRKIARVDKRLLVQYTSLAIFRSELQFIRKFQGFMHIYYLKVVRKVFVKHEYKEGIIYSKKGTIYTKIEFSLTAQDEKIYEVLKGLSELLRNQETMIKISYVQDEIVDEKPDAPVEDGEDKEVDTDLVLPKFTYVIKNMIFKDEDIYGKDFDGKNPLYRIIWQDNDGTEYIVPLEGIDEFEPKNPNGAVSYNSETHELIFSTVSVNDVNYILRRYKTNG